ncbi:heavy metal transporter [Erwinia typographi]|uniref:Nickel/cobalt efflux system n=1 Tax=Erwinia typographi TaxID=371042 RepID=A0A0A3Z7L6_9GAMM|nr:nickel/cobalt efflux transporter [Erwinia typographi]KGT95042.1 heavy metal transporter [Erwinia typographi]
MMDFAALLQQGVGNVWLFIPSAILLGALHGLEPGHSKTMMAAFIIAVRGTVKQAALLGLAATLSHTLIVWAIALGGMYISNRFTADAAEPWMQLISGFIILATAAWMAWRTWRDARDWQNGHGHDHPHAHGHDHDHHHTHGHSDRHHYAHDSAHAQHQHFHGLASSHSHAAAAGYLHSHVPASGHGQSLTAGQAAGVALPRIDLRSAEYQDAHAKAHASDIEKRFANRKVTTGQIVLFGLTGGLIPCPAAITVLLLCIQVKAFSLGALLVLCFSIGLALTLVTVGVGAALSLKHATKRWSGLSTFAHRAPYFSSALIAAVGLYMALHGWMGIMG